METARIPIFVPMPRSPAVDLRGVAATVVRGTKAFAADRKVAITNAVGAIDVVGDREALIALVTRLVRAAIERSPRHGEVAITAAPGEGGILLRIVDRGATCEAHSECASVWYEPRVPTGRSACLWLCPA